MNVKEAKEILGKSVDKLTDEEVQIIITSFEYIAEAWLDSQERQVFNGLTINELTIDSH